MITLNDAIQSHLESQIPDQQPSAEILVAGTGAVVVFCVRGRLVANGVAEPRVVEGLKNEPSSRVSRKALRNELMENIRRRYGGLTKICFQTSLVVDTADGGMDMGHEKFCWGAGA